MSEQPQLNQTHLPISLHIALLSALLYLPGLLQAQDTGDEPVHWAYAAFLGTGWYQLDENQEVFVLRIPPRWYFRDASIDAAGQRSVGIEFHFPLTFGLHRFEELEDLTDFDNIGTLSFNPGVEIEYPVTDRWRLRAYGHFGWGTEVDTSDTAWIFDAGVKSRFAFQSGKLEWALVNEVFYAGYNEKKHGADSGASDSLAGVMAGVDFSYPISLRSGMGDALKLKWDISYRRFANDALFTSLNRSPDVIEDEWELGVAFTRQDGPINFWFMSFEQIGLIYRFDTSGNFQAITLNFRSPFTR